MYQSIILTSLYGSSRAYRLLVQSHFQSLSALSVKITIKSFDHDDVAKVIQGCCFTIFVAACHLPTLSASVMSLANSADQAAQTAGVPAQVPAHCTAAARKHKLRPVMAAMSMQQPQLLIRVQLRQRREAVKILKGAFATLCGIFKRYAAAMRACGFAVTCRASKSANRCCRGLTKQNARTQPWYSFQICQGAS